MNNFDKLTKIYMQCVKKAVHDTMLDFKGEEWFEYLKEADKKKEGKKQIIQRYDRIDALDFQACNKLLAYDKELWNQICTYYHCEDLSRKDSKDMKEPSKKYVDAVFALIEFRNAFGAHNSYEEEDVRAYQTERLRAVENMRFILEGLFSDVSCDEAEGKRFIEIFKEQSLQFYMEGEKKRYFLKDYLNKDEYDVSLLYEECLRLGIQLKMEDGEEYFYSSDVKRDILILKNVLKKKSETKLQESKPIGNLEKMEEPDNLENNEVVVHEKSGVKYKKEAVVVGIIVVILCIIMGLALRIPKVEEKEQILTLKEGAAQWKQEDGMLWCYLTVLNEKQEEFSYEKVVVDMELILSDDSTRNIQMVFDLFDFSKEETSITLSTCTSFKELMIEDGIKIKSMSFDDYRFE